MPHACMYTHPRSHWPHDGRDDSGSSVRTTFDSEHPKWERTTTEGRKNVSYRIVSDRIVLSMCEPVSVSSWANCVLLFVIVVLPFSHIGLMSRVRARLFCTAQCVCCVYDIDMRATITLVTYAVPYSAHRYAPKNSYDTWTHIKMPPMPFTLYMCYHVML